MDNDLLKLKTSLCDAIHKWIEKEECSDLWAALKTYVSDYTPELMADSAFNILLIQQDLSEYYKREELLK